MKFTYYGHACFAVEAGGKTLLFDPFISPNPLAKKIDVSKVAADFILVSHGHGDHIADVVESGDGNFYYSGDTALTLDMKLIGETAKLSFAVFPIGDFFTMGIDDAIRAAEFVGVNKFVGVHYDTFPPIKLDHDGAKRVAQAAGMKLLLPAIGETVHI